MGWRQATQCLFQFNLFASNVSAVHREGHTPQHICLSLDDDNLACCYNDLLNLFSILKTLLIRDQNNNGSKLHINQIKTFATSSRHRVPCTCSGESQPRLHDSNRCSLIVPHHLHGRAFCRTAFAGASSVHTYVCKCFNNILTPPGGRVDLYLTPVLLEPLEALGPCAHFLHIHLIRMQEQLCTQRHHLQPLSLW